MSSQPSQPSRPGGIPALRSADALFPPHVVHRRSKAGLDVLLTKAAIDFQNLANEHADALVRLNLEALRDAAGLDALLIATFDSEHSVIEHVVGVTGLFATFNPETLRGESLEIPYTPTLVTLEVLDISLVFFGGIQCFKRPEVLAPFCFWIFLPRIKSVFT